MEKNLGNWTLCNIIKIASFLLSIFFLYIIFLLFSYSIIFYLILLFLLSLNVILFIVSSQIMKIENTIKKNITNRKL